MRLCLIGEFRARRDEGYTNVASNLADQLAAYHSVLRLNPWEVKSARFWRAVAGKRPELIHYLTAPTILSFWVLRMLALRWGHVATVMSALHPDGLALRQSRAFRKSTLVQKPDLVLVQTHEMEQVFAGQGYKTMFFPNGVNIDKFRPRSPDEKILLRRKYGIAEDQFIVLHVGHVRRDRNVQVLSRIQHQGWQVLLVGSTYRGGADTRLLEEIRESGCLVWTRYVPNIEEIYALADCYVFPSQGDGCLQQPLSVMEAMACNLPVVSTRFGALPELFEQGEGLYFADGEQDYIPLIDKIKSVKASVNTRKKVIDYTWEALTQELNKIYESVRAGK